MLAETPVLLTVLFSSWRIHELTVHPELSVLVGFSGAVIAVVTGVLIVAQVAKNQNRLTAAGVCLVGCGILDSFYTFLPAFAGSAALQSSSLALCGAGMSLACLRSANEWLRKHLKGAILLTVVGACTVPLLKLGAIHILEPEVETLRAVFALLGRSLSIAAGISFFAALAYFLKQHFHADKRNQLIMAVACVLMCAATIGDSSGATWTSHWWGSHVFQLIGYTLILLYVLEAQRTWSNTLDSEHKRLLTILDGLDEYIYISNPETDELLFVNERVKDTFGDDLVGKSGCEILHGEPRPSLPSSRNRISEGHLDKTQVWEFQNQQTKRWYRCSEKSIVWTDGNLARLRSATDITEQKQNLTALQESDERLRQIAETLDAVFWLYDTVSEEILYVSPAFKLIFGCHPDEIGRDPLRWINQIVEEDRTRVREAFDRGATVGYNIEYRVTGADGQQRTIHDRGFPIIGSEGQTIRLAGIAHDVTGLRLTEAALKQSRDNFKLALESAQAGVFFYEFKEDRLRWDERSLEIYGLAGEEFRGDLTGWEDRLHRDDAENALNTFFRALKSKETHLSLRYRIARPDQEIRHILGTMIIEYDERGEPKQLTGLHFDETPKVEMDVELIQAQRAAESANRAKSTFLANMSHEIRSPMNAVMGFLQLLQMEDSIQPHQKRWLDLMWRGSEHLLELINEVLDISKIEAGMTSLRITDFQLAETLEETVAIFRMKATKQGLKLDFHHGPGIDRSISSDKGKIRQILINLLSNALKFTETGGISVRAEIAGPLQAENASTKHLIIEVSDTGIGLSPADIDGIFEPFAQTEVGEAHTAGTGLGLTLCKEYAQLMAGHIEVTSDLGQGSCFKVTLEVEAAPDTEQADPHQHLISAVPTAKGKNVKTLVVDDDPFATRMMGEMLERLGCDSSFVNSGEKALINFSESDYELIFLDIRMPGIGGEKTLQSLKKQIRNEKVRIVVLSAGIFEEDRQRLLAKGADEVLYKPIHFRQVSEQIAKVES